MNKSLMGIFLMVLSSISFAQDWQPIAENDHYQISMNFKNIQAIEREGQNLLKVWTNWMVYREQGVADQGRGEYTMVMYYINCQTQRIAEASRTSYYATGLEKSSKATTWHELRPVEENSIAAIIVEKSCQMS